MMMEDENLFSYQEQEEAILASVWKL